MHSSRDTRIPVRYNYVPNFPKISKPTIIGYFSVDKDRNMVCTAENLKYLKIPEGNFNLNLNNGYENVIHKPDSAADEKIDHLLRYILWNKGRLFQTDGNEGLEQSRFDFVAFRGLLRLIMCSPYEQRDDWCILATKYRGIIYLCQLETERKKQARLAETESSKRFCSYGFKFEQYLLTDDPQKDPDTTIPVNESEEFCCMYETNLNHFKILYGAEMDGILSNKIEDISKVDLNDLEFVELKVKGREATKRQEQNFYKFKVRNWWCQSFLVGINKIIVGLRNDKGIVNEIKEMHLKALVNGAKSYWSASVCMDFLLRFLTGVENILRDVNCPYTVYKFDWDPLKQKTIGYNVYHGKNDLTFLRDWYIDKLRKE